MQPHVVLAIAQAHLLWRTWQGLAEFREALGCDAHHTCEAARKELDNLKNIVKKSGMGRNGISAVERALRFSEKAWLDLPESARQAHSWVDCSACMHDLCALKLLGRSAGTYID